MEIAKRKDVNFRKKSFADIGWILTFNDILTLPGYTSFTPADCDISANLGPFHFESPIISAAMDTVTEEEMAIHMALYGGLGILHRNCTFMKQLEMVKKVKRARNFIIEDVATVSPDVSVKEVKEMMKRRGISGFPVIDVNRKVIGIVTQRDIPFDDEYDGIVENIMTKDPICLPANVSREEGLAKLYEIRKEKIPLIDSNGFLAGLITKKDLKSNYPYASKDEKGRLLCGLACSPFLPKNPEDLKIFKQATNLADILMTDVAEFHKKVDIEATKELMEVIDSKFVVGNIGTYKGAEDLLCNADFPEDKFIGIKVGMGSGSICTTSIQTGVGAPTFYATAQVADAIKDYAPGKINLISDGGFKVPGDLTKAFAVGADMIMSGHFFAGCTESPGILDNIEGRKVKIYRGMGSKEARSVGTFVFDRYIKESKKLAEGVSGYIPFVGPLHGLLASLEDGLKNGLIYAGAKDLSEAYKIQIGRISSAGVQESRVHDLIR